MNVNQFSLATGMGVASVANAIANGMAESGARNRLHSAYMIERTRRMAAEREIVRLRRQLDSASHLIKLQAGA